MAEDVDVDILSFQLLNFNFYIYITADFIQAKII